MDIKNLQEFIVDNYDKLLYQTSIGEIQLFEEADSFISVYFDLKWKFRVRYVSKESLLAIIGSFIDYGREQFFVGYDQKEKEIREVLGIK